MGRKTKDRSNTQYYSNTPKYSTLADIFRSNNHNHNGNSNNNDNSNPFRSARARRQVVDNMSTNIDRPSTNYSKYSNNNKDNINNNNINRDHHNNKN